RITALQRQRARVLEALAKGVSLDRVLLRLARHAERHRPGSSCTILTLDQAGERVASVVSLRHDTSLERAAGQPIAALAEPLSCCFGGAGPALIPQAGGTALWAMPMKAASGRLLGCLVLQLAGGASAQVPEPDGP